MAHFAIIAPPLRGHYRPLSNLAAALIARGHRVTFVHQEEARSLVEAEGAAFEPLGSSEPPVERWTTPMRKIRGLIGLGSTMRRMERFTTTFCREGPALLRRLGVDAVIADQLEPAGGLLAEHLDIPWISIADTLPMNREPGVPPPFVGWRYDPSGRGLRRNEGGWKVTNLLLRSFNRTIERNAQELGLPRRARIEDCFSPLLQLSQMVPDLDFPRRELPQSFHYTGPFRGPAAQDFELPPGDGRPTVYASLGTLQGSRTPLFRKIASACDHLRLRLVITHGGLADAAVLRSLPGKPLVYDWLPQESVVAQCDLVVCHAGMNTVLDPLSAGVPMVVMPLTFEQPGIAARVAYSGAGLAVSRRSTTRGLAKAIGTVLRDPSYAARAARLREEMKAAGGAPRAAELIEQSLGASALSATPTKARAARDDARDDSRSGSKSAATRAS